MCDGVKADGDMILFFTVTCDFGNPVLSHSNFFNASHLCHALILILVTICIMGYEYVDSRIYRTLDKCYDLIVEIWLHQYYCEENLFAKHFLWQCTQNVGNNRVCIVRCEPYKIFFNSIFKIDNSCQAKD